MFPAMPFFIEEPTNVHSSEEEDAEFICKAGGSPKPAIYWSIDGVPVDRKSEHTSVIRVHYLRSNNLTAMYHILV